MAPIFADVRTIGWAVSHKANKDRRILGLGVLCALVRDLFLYVKSQFYLCENRRHLWLLFFAASRKPFSASPCPACFGVVFRILK